MASKSITPAETPKTWSFHNADVAAKFDTHVREQLAWYADLSRYVADMAISFVPKNGIVFDIGASTGHMTKLMKDDLESKGARVISVEPSHEMAAMWSGTGELRIIDAENINFASSRPDVAILFLTLMFMLPAIRERFVADLLINTKPGGSVIVVDKGYLDCPPVQVACKNALMADKRRNGQSGESWVTKELALRGEQRPTNRSLLIETMRREDFDCEEFFRFGEFYGVMGVKRAL